MSLKIMSEPLPLASDWTGEVSGGGLHFVNNQTYQFSFTMEMTTRKQLASKVAPTVTTGRVSNEKLNVRETKCHCYGIANYVVVVQNQVMPLCFKKNDKTTVEPLYDGHHWGMRFWPL